MHIRRAGYQPKQRRLEPASVEELAVIVENMPEERQLMVLLASWRALRYGEIAELRRKDIVFALCLVISFWWCLLGR